MDLQKDMVVMLLSLLEGKALELSFNEMTKDTNILTQFCFMSVLLLVEVM